MNEVGEQRAVLIAGPTASGKTALAIEKARALGGRVINADSMQTYAVLARLTARPNREELAAAPHHLFGHVDPGVRYSTGAWLADAEKQIQEARAANQVPIFVGGTGLYFDALTNGFAPIPPVPEAVIEEVRARVEGLDAAARMTLLAEIDPAYASTLKVADPQRVVRAVAVQAATGVPLSAHQKHNSVPLLEGFVLERIVLMPERTLLRQRIADRFEAMVAAGALEEVAHLEALGLDPELPAMKAIGVRELSAFRAGRLDLDEAIARAVTATRQYAKRQSSWFRNRMSDWQFIDPFG